MDQMVQFADLSKESASGLMFGLKGAGQPYNPEGYQVTLNPGEFDKATRPYNIGVNKQHSDGLKR